MLKLSLAIAALGVALLALSALPGRAATPAATTHSPTAAVTSADADYGRALFSAKGCVTCHHHGAIPGSGQLGGSDVPDLTNYTANADFLRTWLKDPRAIRPNTWMPNLELKQDEIEALIAFLSAKQ
jgi:cytochrome c2